MTTHDRLLSILAERSARRGQFMLASGRQSTLYIDARLTTMSPDGLALIGPLALAALHEVDWRVHAIGGLTLGADPISYAIAYASAETASPLRAFTVRKEAKAHGTGRLIEGPFREGSVGHQQAGEEEQQHRAERDREDPEALKERRPVRTADVRANVRAAGDGRDGH